MHKDLWHRWPIIIFHVCDTMVKMMSRQRIFFSVFFFYLAWYGTCNGTLLTWAVKSKQDMVLGLWFSLRCTFINQIMSNISRPALVLPDLTLRTQTGTSLVFNVKMLLVNICFSVFSCNPVSVPRWKVHIQSETPQGYQARYQDDENLLGPKTVVQLLLQAAAAGHHLQHLRRANRWRNEGNIQPGCSHSLWTVTNLPVKLSAIVNSCITAAVYLHHFTPLSENKEYSFFKTSADIFRLQWALHARAMRQGNTETF